jgi:hypothetical protein
VPDPPAGAALGRAAAAGVPEVGRRRARPARGRRRVPDRRPAGRGRVARAVDRQGGHAGLAGLLPPAQPPRRGAAAQPVAPGAAPARRVARAHPRPARVHALRRRGAAAAGARGRLGRPARPPPVARCPPRRGPGAARLLRRRPAGAAGRTAAGGGPAPRRPAAWPPAGAGPAGARGRAHHRAQRPPGPPAVRVPADQARLWQLSRLDSAWVDTVAGTTAEHRRDPRTAAVLLGRTLRLHARVARGWPRLRSTYRAALPELVGTAAWERTLRRRTSPDEVA